MFHTDAHRSGKVGYKSGNSSKVVQSPYNSVKKSELYSPLMVLMDFTDPLNIVTDSQHAKKLYTLKLLNILLMNDLIIYTITGNNQ